MANYKLVNHYWDTSGVYDITEGKTQKAVNADVKAALNGKFPNPTNTGDSGKILRSNGQGGSVWDDAATSEEIGEAVTDWLDDNIPTGQTVVVDTSLTVSGAAADSKMVGDTLAKQSETIAPYNISELTRNILSQDKQELMDLVTSSVTNVNKRSVVLDKNRIKQTVTASSPTGQTFYAFLISGTPRHVGGSVDSTIPNFTPEDFLPLNFNDVYNLYIRASLFGRNTINSTSAMAVRVVTRNSTTGDITQVNYNLNASYPTDRCLEVVANLCKDLPEIVANKNIAIVAVSKYACSEVEMAIDLFTGRADSAVDTNPVAEFQNPNTASKQYYKGEYFLKQDKLYRATSNIASGTNIDVGTNAEVTTVGKELNKITNSDTQQVKITDVPLIRGSINQSGVPNTTSTNRARTSFFIAFEDALSPVKISGKSGYDISLRYYNRKTGSFLRSDSEWSSTQTLTWNKDEFIRIVIRNSDNSNITNATLLKNCVEIEYTASNDYPTPSLTGFEKQGTPTIVTSKTLHYADGTQPKVDYYVVLSPITRILYKTKDFSSYEKLCRVPFLFPEIYSYAVTNNDDIIALFNVQALYDPNFDNAQNGTDDCRRNPYVFLKTENYSVAHEVDFGNNVKPTGWLNNSSYLNTDDGFVFCEYTRTCAATCNAWKVTGDITDSTNWVKKLTLTLSGLNTGIKHMHCLLNDPFTGYYYLSTGDDNNGSKTYYSTDQGSTWTLLFEGEEKYSRYCNMIFTEDYVYWATDSSKSNLHFLFRTVRNNDNIISFTDIETLQDLNNEPAATYATVYLEPLNKLFIAERRDDANGNYVDILVYDIASDTISAVKRIYSVSNDRLAFRCLYIDYVSRNNVVVCGYGSNYVNHNGGYLNFVKMFGNAANNDARFSCNNIILRFTDDSVTLDTIT